MYILNCVRMGSEESFRQPDEARRLLRRRVHSVRRSERDGRTGFAALGRRAPISPVRTVRVGDGPDGRVHPEEYRKWRNDPNHQCTACESEGKSGVRDHGRLISQTFQRLLLSSCTRCDASDVLRCGKQARQLIAIRLDPRVIAEFRKEAKRRNLGYQTLINEVLAKHVKRRVSGIWFAFQRL